MSLPNGDFICQKYLCESLFIVQFDKNSINILFTIEKTHGVNFGATYIRVMSDKEFVTCGDDGTIKIWKGTRPYSQTPLHMIENPGKERVLNILHYPKLNALLSISRKHDPEFSDMSFYAVRKWTLIP